MTIYTFLWNEHPFISFKFWFEFVCLLEIGKEASFKHGFGFGLIYLVRNELNKMVELRKRIEYLPQHFQTEVDDEDDKHHSVPSRSSFSSSLAKTCEQEIMYAEEHNSGQYSSPNDSNGFGRDGFRRQKSFKIDQLEAELEAEFNRLQMDAEFFNSEVLASLF